MKFYITLLFSLLTYCALAQDTPQLVINPKGHTALISASVLTPDEKELITVSHDKTVKIWSTQYGNLIGEIHGERGESNRGQLYTVALSNDGKYLATGGYLIEEKDETAYGVIRLYDYKSRKLIKAFRGHKNVVHGLSFSPDGKFLASAGGDGKIIVWNISTKNLHHEFQAHTQTARTLTFIANDILVSGGWDNKLVKMDINKKSILTSKQIKNNPVNEIVYNKELDLICIAFNDYSKVVLVNSDFTIKHEVDIYQPVATVYSKGKILLAGQERKPYMATLFHYDGKEFKVSNGFNGLNNTITSCGFLQNGIAYCTGGRDHEVQFWSYTPPDKNGMVSFAKEGFRAMGYGMGVCAVGIAGEYIGFTQGECDASFGRGTMRYVFHLLSGGLYNLNKEQESAFKGIYLTNGKYSLQHEKGGLLNYPSAVLRLDEDQKNRWSVTLDEYSGYSNNAYSFAGTDYVVTATNSQLYVFNLNGEQIAKLKGHEGEIRALWTAKDGKYLISAGLDQTIRLWNLENLKNEKQFMPYEQLYSSSVKFFKSKYPDLDFSSPAGMKTLYEKVLHDFGDDTAKYLVTPQVIEPEFNVFIGWNNEWIIWTHDGYFKSSKEAAKYIGYHINKGFDADAKFLPFDQFDLKFNRPDIVNQRLGIGDSTYNSALKAAHDRRLKKMGLNENDLQQVKNLPEVEIVSVGGNTDNENYLLEFTANDQSQDLFTIHVYNNDVPVFGTKGLEVTEANKRNLKKSLQIPLVEGENKISVDVVNKAGVSSFRQEVKVTYTSVNVKHDLYLITIGVSEYANKSYNLKYAAKDAKDMEAAWSSGNNYSKVYSKSLVNAAVNKNMLAEIRSFLKNCKANDQVVIFIAGHGVLDSKFDYYFATADMDFNSPEKNGIAFAEIEKILDEIKALKKLLIMDTCHSGEVDKDDVVADNAAVTKTTNVTFRNVGTAVKHKSMGMQQTTELMKELFFDMRKGTGATIISSAGGYELAMESDEWNNGLFTYVMLNGIKTKEADLDKNGSIMISELKDYVAAKVFSLSNGVQSPTFRNENISFDYRIK